MKTKFSLLSGVSFVTLCFGVALNASAQATPTPVAEDEDPILRAETVVVQGEIAYRNRSEETVQTLEYGQDYFQRFEPLTAGDALKRVPSVTFLSDVIESDGARLRGLDPGYTQILINGEKVPGNGVDRSFFLDRIPAELIDRVEIVRSSSARRSGDALAGTLNIVLRDGYELDGGYLRAGALRFDDGEFKESLGGVYGGELGPGRIILGANLQGRYNPKLKSSLRFGDSPENDPDFRANEFDNREDQTDTRDGRDYSFNAEYAIDAADYDFELGGFYVFTDRDETERSFEYDDPTAITGPLPDGNLLTDNSNVNGIEQTNYSLRSRYERDWSLGETVFKLGFAKFDDDQEEYEEEVDFDVDYDDGEVPVIEGEFFTTEIVDEETSAEISHSFEFGEETELEFGVFYQQKDRSTRILAAEDGRDLDMLTGYDQFTDRPEDFGLSYSGFEAVPGGLSNLQEDRLDGFVVLNGDYGRMSWETGLRYETTDVTINDQTADAALQNVDTDYAFLLPSAHMKFDITGADRISVSVARTLRRPNFNFVSPVLLEGEFGDNDFIGEPELEPENA